MNQLEACLPNWDKILEQEDFEAHTRTDVICFFPLFGSFDLEIHHEAPKRAFIIHIKGQPEHHCDHAIVTILRDFEN